ncbi:YeeE/YedE family protein [Paeniroseomonas aquatica]
MDNFTPVSAFFGGVLIGLSVVVLLLTNGRIAGVSGVVSGLLVSRVHDAGWRLAFILGLIAAPLLYAAVAGGCRRLP